MITYRPDLDGLRALAVLSVVLFHAGFPPFSGGFVGVDIFFVLSGYLITSITLREMIGGSFTFAGFYERRVRRLLPPLIPVLLLTWVASALLLEQAEFSSFAGSLASTLVLSANWYFYSTVGYFDGPGELTPLLHMWSLAIEEQFYLIFPFILFVLIKRNLRPLGVCVGLLAVSLLYSTYLAVVESKDLLFYGSIGRFWELLVGACLAFAKKPNFSQKTSFDVLEILGVALIAIALLGYDAEMMFPGPAALIPTMGVALIIYAGGNGRIVSPLLKLKPMVWVGLISYGLYLWHWPIMVFIRQINPLAGPVAMTAAIAASFVLSIASYRWLEKPIRARAWLCRPKSLYGLSSLAVAFLVVVSGLSAVPALEAARAKFGLAFRDKFYDHANSDALKQIFLAKALYHSELNLNYDGSSGVFDIDKHRGWTCSFDNGNSQENVMQCLISQAKERNILVIGDSVGRDTSHALRRAYPNHNFLVLHHSGCAPAELITAAGTSLCFPDLNGTLRKITGALNVSGVVMNFRYRPGKWTGIVQSIPEIRKVTKNVVLLGVSPVFKRKVDEYIRGLSGGDGIPLYVSKDDPKMVPWSFDDLAVGAQKVARKQDIEFADVRPFFCDQDRCRLWLDESKESPLFWDNVHMTNEAITQYAIYLRSVSSINAVVNAR